VFRSTKRQNIQHVITKPDCGNNQHHRKQTTMKIKARIAAALALICLGAGMYYVADHTAVFAEADRDRFVSDVIGDIFPENGILNSGLIEDILTKSGFISTTPQVADVAENDPLEETGTSPSLFELSRDKETIYFWYSDENLTDYFTSAAVAFGEEHNIRVIPQLAEQSEYLEAVNEASLYDDQMPDLYLTTHDTLEKAYLAGLATEVESAGYVDADHFPVSALAAVTYHNKLVAYPFSYDTSVLLYNETYLEQWARQQAEREAAAISEGEEGSEEAMSLDEEAVAIKAAEYMENAVPLTVDDILHIADTFDVPEGVEGVMKWDVSDIFYNYWFVGNSMIVGGVAGDDPYEINVSNSDTAESLEVYKSLNQFFSIESNTVDYETVLQDFIDGKTVFTIATVDAAKRLEEVAAREDYPYVLKAALIPDVSPALQSRSMSVTNVVAVNGYSQHKVAANAFAAYLTTEYAKNLYDRTGRAPATLQAAPDHPLLQFYMSEYATGIPLPKMMATGNYWISLEVLFSKVWNGGDVVTLLGELSDRMINQLSDIK
jgi:maltose-binding protein MalE